MTRGSSPDACRGNSSQLLAAPNILHRVWLGPACPPLREFISFRLNRSSYSSSAAWRREVEATIGQGLSDAWHLSNWRIRASTGQPLPVLRAVLDNAVRARSGSAGGLSLAQQRCVATAYEWLDFVRPLEEYRFPDHPSRSQRKLVEALVRG